MEPDDQQQQPPQQPQQPEPRRYDAADDNLARHGAPVPPPAIPAGAAYDPAATATPPRRHGPRLFAAGTALAVVAVAAGAGFVLGHHERGTVTAGGPASGYAGQGPGSGTGGNGGSESSPFGGGENQFGGNGQFGGTPFTGPGGSGNGTGNSPFDSSSSGTPATDSQLTGLVRIASTLKYEGGKAAGTGMILTSTGEVITNHHVVEGSTKLRVTVMSTGATYKATVVGTDAKDDVAVLQLNNASGLSTVTTDDDGISVGDSVTAVGDANGDTDSFTAAAGELTATGKNITTQSEGSAAGEKLKGLLEISSDVISGDSGGATYDDEGEVVGMTTAASTGSRDVTGYAIPIAKVLRIATDLQDGIQNARYEYGSPAFLGLGLTGTATQVGAVYDGTPAARAGVSAGDTITRIGSTRVRTADQLRAAVRTYSPGDSVRLTWTDSSGTSHIATVTLIAGPIA